MLDGWAPELTALITAGDTPPVVRPLHTLRPGHRWARVPGVTLLGADAPLGWVAMMTGAERAS